MTKSEVIQYIVEVKKQYKYNYTKKLKEHLKSNNFICSFMSKNSCDFTTAVYCIIEDISPICKYGCTRKHFNNRLLLCGYTNTCKCNREISVKKKEKTCVKKYGVKSFSQTKEFNEKVKNTSIEKYGTNHPTKSKIVKDNAKKTCLERYGFASFTQTKKYKKQSKATKLERYGDENYNNRDKAKGTKLERYGDSGYVNPTKTKATKLERYGDENYNNIYKAKGTCLRNYGVEYSFQSDTNIRKSKKTKLERYGDSGYVNPTKTKATKLERYGDENYNNRDKAKGTCLTQYGVDHTSELSEVKQKNKRTKLERYGDENYNNRDKAKGTCLTQYGVESYSQYHISNNTLEKLYSKEWLIKEHHKLKKSMLQISKELNVDSSTISKYLHRYNIEVKHFYQSYPEKQLSEYIKETYNTEVISNSRKIIKPYEIDIYLPEYNLAIEYNGIYWHRPEVYGSKLQWFLYHQNKEELCNLQGIRLLHLWENYYNHNALLNNAICSIIDNNLELTYKEIYE